MKTSLTASLSLVGLLSAFPAPAQTAASGRPGASWTSRQFQEVDTLFANPGQGWMSQARAPKAEPRFPCSVVYIRFNWADIEPEQGQYKWQVIDDVIAAWKPRGTTVAFRVMTCNAHSAGYYASPKWLFDAGCKGFEYLLARLFIHSHAVVFHGEADVGARPHIRMGAVKFSADFHLSRHDFDVAFPVNSLGGIIQERSENHLQLRKVHLH